jgi:hypothetical protein
MPVDCDKSRKYRVIPRQPLKLQKDVHHNKVQGKEESENRDPKQEKKQKTKQNKKVKLKLNKSIITLNRN